MCSARPCVERRARAAAQAQAQGVSPKVKSTSRVTPTRTTGNKVTVKSPVTRISKRGK